MWLLCTELIDRGSVQKYESLMEKKCKEISIDDCCHSSSCSNSLILIVHPCLQLGGEAEDLSARCLFDKLFS